MVSTLTCYLYTNTATIAEGLTLANNPTRYTNNHLAFNRHKSVRVLAKSADGSVYGIEYQGQRGLASAKHIREERIVSKTADLQMVSVSAVEWLNKAAPPAPATTTMSTQSAETVSATTAKTIAKPTETSAKPTETNDNSAQHVGISKVEVQPIEALSTAETATNSSAKTIDTSEPNDEAINVAVDEPQIVKKTAYLTTEPGHQPDPSETEDVPKLELLVQPPAVAKVHIDAIGQIDTSDPQPIETALLENVTKSIETSELMVADSSKVVQPVNVINVSDAIQTSPTTDETIIEDQHTATESILNEAIKINSDEITETFQQNGREAEKHSGEHNDDEAGDQNDDGDDYDQQVEDENAEIIESPKTSSNTEDNIVVPNENSIEMALDRPVDNSPNDIPTLFAEKQAQSQEQQPNMPNPTEHHYNHHGQDHNNVHNDHLHNPPPSTESHVVGEVQQQPGQPIVVPEFLPPSQPPPLSRLPLMQPPLVRKLSVRDEKHSAAYTTQNIDLPAAVDPLKTASVVEQHQQEADKQQFNQPPVVDAIPPPTPTETIVSDGLGGVPQLNNLALALEAVSAEQASSDSSESFDVVGDVWSTVSQWFSAVSTSTATVTSNDASADEILVQFGKFVNLF